MRWRSAPFPRTTQHMMGRWGKEIRDSERERERVRQRVRVRVRVDDRIWVKKYVCLCIWVRQTDRQTDRQIDWDSDFCFYAFPLPSPPFFSDYVVPIITGVVVAVLGYVLKRLHECLVAHGLIPNADAAKPNGGDSFGNSGINAGNKLSGVEESNADGKIVELH